LRTRWVAPASSRDWCCTPTPLPTKLLALGWLIALALAATVARPAPATGPFARDFEAYYAAGATWNAGGDPYSRDVWRVERTIAGVDARHDEVLPFVGPPVTLPVWSCFARLPFDLARALWLALLAVAAGALIVASLALAGVSLRTGWPAVALATVSGPLISAMALGQLALLAAAAVALALLGCARRGWWTASATFVAAFQPNLVLPLAAWMTARRALLTIAATALVFLVACIGCAGGPSGALAYVHVVAAHGAAERFIAIQYALPAVFASFGIPHAVAQVLAGAVALAALALAARVAWTHRSRPLVAACIAIAVLPLTAPFFHEHDFAVVLIPAIVLAARAGARARALAGIAAVATFVDWFGVAQRPAVAPQTLALAAAVACAYGLLARRNGDAPWVALAPLAAAAVIAAVALPLAAAFPAPVWPDALGAFHAAARAPIATVWAQEQQRAGLGAAVAAWGFLRLIPLAGCALLAFAALRAFADQNEYRSGFQNGVVMTGVAEKPLRSLL
jgi:hypothetical protein